jgi:hypothetical protein
METKSILVKDTEGLFSKELYKLYPELSAVSVGFDYTTAHQEMRFTADNIRYSSLPGGGKSLSYATFLTYNGTMGYDGRVFSTVVNKSHGVFNYADIPSLLYKPNEYISNLHIPTAASSVLEINQLTSSIRIFDYSTLPYTFNDRTYEVKYEHSYPVIVTGLPNIVNKTVFLDGWYSYTHVIFRDVEVGGPVTAGKVYAYIGFIFVASHSGSFNLAPITKNPIIYEAGFVGTPPKYYEQVNKRDYETILFYLGTTDTTDPQAGAMFVHSQVLVLQQIKDAIVKEVTGASACYKTACDWMDWQKLKLKQVSAYVLFDNLSFEKAQIVVESSRSMCLGNLDNTKPC